MSSDRTTGAATLLVRAASDPPLAVPGAVAEDAGDRALSGPRSGLDVSEELSALRARVVHLEREIAARDEFISAVGHELRNPLSPVLLHLQRLDRACQTAPGGQISASWLSGQVQAFNSRLIRFLSVLDRILDASRIEAGRLELVIETVDLTEVTREVVAGFERELTVAQSSLSLSLVEGVSGQWDRMRIEQIVGNLLTNAIRYGAGSPIEVSVSAEGDRAILRVSDHGIGIPESDQERIFLRFVRSGSASRRGGFGIGLWVVREICRAMGGTVSVTSQEGQGSQFTVTLPRQGAGAGHD